MSISSPGLGSGLDVNAIVSQLMAVERQPIVDLTRKEAGITAKISGMGSLKGALSALQSASASLNAADSFTALKATVGDSAAASASASASAVAGSYSLEVTQLAQAHLVHTAANPTLADGTINIQVGSGTAIDITVNAADSLSDLAARINADSTLASQLKASVVDNKLTLESKSSGTANAITVIAQPGLEAFDSVNLSEARAAQDAQIKLNGITITRSSNTITDVVPNVTLTLSKATTSATTLTVGRDVAGVQTALNNFVKAYNEAIKTISSLGSYNAETKEAAVLNGNATLRSVQSQVRGALNTVPSSLTSTTSVTTLAQLGVSVQRDGSLKLDTTKLKTAFDTDPTAVAKAAAAYGKAMDTATYAMTSTGGLVTSQIDGLNRSVADIEKRSAALQSRLVTVEKNYRAQYAALDTLMAKMSKTSSFLTQQLAALSSSSN